MNFILTGDSAFAFDPVPYTINYDCFTYADVVRGQAPPLALQVIPVQAPAPAPIVKPPQVVQNPVQVIPMPA